MELRKAPAGSRLASSAFFVATPILADSIHLHPRFGSEGLLGAMHLSLGKAAERIFVDDGVTRQEETADAGRNRLTLNADAWRAMNDGALLLRGDGSSLRIFVDLSEAAIPAPKRQELTKLILVRVRRLFFNSRLRLTTLLRSDARWCTGAFYCRGRHRSIERFLRVRTATCHLGFWTRHSSGLEPRMARTQC